MVSFHIFPLLFQVCPHYFKHLETYSKSPLYVQKLVIIQLTVSLTSNMRWIQMLNVSSDENMRSLETLVRLWLEFKLI